MKEYYCSKGNILEIEADLGIHHQCIEDVIRSGYNIKAVKQSEYVKLGIRIKYGWSMTDYVANYQVYKIKKVKQK